MANELTGMGRAFIHLAPYLARWVVPEIWSFVRAEFFGLQEASIQLLWGDDCEIEIFDGGGIHIIRNAKLGNGGFRCWHYDNWDGVLPSDFAAIMDKHFRREVVG